MSPAKCLVVDVFRKNVKIETMTCLNDFYKALSGPEVEVDTFDIARLFIAGNFYDIYVDDIGLFREKLIASCVSDDMKPMLVGNLVIANSDSDGNTTSLSKSDLHHILRNIYTAFSPEVPDGYPCIFNCSYEQNAI